MLLHIPGVLSAPAVQALREQLVHAPWTDGLGTVGALGATVKRNRQVPGDSPQGRALAQAVEQAVRQQPLFVSAALPRQVLPPLFNRYEGGETYGLHVDGAIRQGPGEALLRADLSCTLFLSAPEDYEGGELVIVDTYGTHEVKLPAGDLVLYPANSLHQVNPVTRGVRLASFFWVQSLVRDDARRAMLFELDQTNQSLLRKLGSCPETLALTNQYHNLLRMWADT